LTKKRILVVDDDAALCERTRHVLTAQGYEVDTTDTPLGVTNRVVRDRIRLVVLDHRLPALDGAPLCALLKRNPLTAWVSVVLYSVTEAEELETLATACGADSWVCKSEAADALVVQVRRLIGPPIEPDGESKPN
jgi:DNA-binding response OmpR family regulator